MPIFSFLLKQKRGCQQWDQTGGDQISDGKADNSAQKYYFSTETKWDSIQGNCNSSFSCAHILFMNGHLVFYKWLAISGDNDLPLSYRSSI